MMSCSHNHHKLELAALHVLHPILGHGPSYLSFQLGFGNPTDVTSQAARIKEYRDRVGRMDDPCVRRAYNKWLDFWQEENDKAREEMTTGVKRAAWLEHQKRSEAERDAIELVAETIPRP